MTKRHNIWSHFRLAALLAVLVLALCGCSSDDVRLPERVDLFRGQQFALASAVEIEGDPDAADVLAALAAADVHGVTVDFASADESVATVDELGIVQGVAPGETTVTVTCAAFGYTARVQVAVLEPAAALTVAPQLTLEPGQTASLDAAVENADPAGLVYTVSDETVAAVDEAGNVTALAQGRADITVSLPGSSLTAVCRLTVGTPVESIQLSRPEASLTAGQTLTLQRPRRCHGGKRRCHRPWRGRRRHHGGSGRLYRRVRTYRDRPGRRHSRGRQHTRHRGNGHTRKRHAGVRCAGHAGNRRYCRDRRHTRHTGVRSHR